MEQPIPVPIDINTVNEGALVDGFGIELQKVLENIRDVNTPATATRSITLTLVLQPHSDRVVIETEVKCSSKIAPIESHKAKMFLGVTEGGAPIAFEDDPRQMIMFTPPAPKEVAQPIQFGTR